MESLLNLVHIHCDWGANQAIDEFRDDRILSVDVDVDDVPTSIVRLAV